MDAVADLADRYSLGEIRVTHRQNLVLVDVKQSELHELWQKLVALELATPNLGLLSDIICCPGLDYCSLANARSIPIAQDISRAFTDLGRAAEDRPVHDQHLGLHERLRSPPRRPHRHSRASTSAARSSSSSRSAARRISTRRSATGSGPGCRRPRCRRRFARSSTRISSFGEQNERFLDTYRRVGIEPFKSAVYGEESRAA